jgi:hypothetical protein
MTKKQNDRPADSWLVGVEAALRRAGLKAKQEAKRLGTPYVVVKDTATLRDARQK